MPKANRTSTSKEIWGASEQQIIDNARVQVMDDNAYVDALHANHVANVQPAKETHVNKMSNIGPDIDPQRYLVTQYIAPKSLTQGLRRREKHQRYSQRFGIGNSRHI